MREQGSATEVHAGAVSEADGVLELTFRTTAIAASATAKRVDSVERRLRVTADAIDYELHMAAVGEPHQLHLTATLRRQS